MELQNLYNIYVHHIAEELLEQADEVLERLKQNELQLDGNNEFISVLLHSLYAQIPNEGQDKCCKTWQSLLLIHRLILTLDKDYCLNHLKELIDKSIALSIKLVTNEYLSKHLDNNKEEDLLQCEQLIRWGLNKLWPNIEERVYEFWVVDGEALGDALAERLELVRQSLDISPLVVAHYQQCKYYKAGGDSLKTAQHTKGETLSFFSNQLQPNPSGFIESIANP